MRRVTAAVIIEEGRLFLARRAPGYPLAGAWELPGGKVEPGETPEECLARELVEELAMNAEVGALLATTTYHYEHGSFEMLAYAVERRSEFELAVHDSFESVTPSEMGSIRLAPADVELIAQLVAAGEWGAAG